VSCKLHGLQVEVKLTLPVTGDVVVEGCRLYTCNGIAVRLG